MQTNIWNIKCSKERLGIRQRTEAQKRHLISLIKAKSKLDDRNKFWKTKSLNSGFLKKQKENILRGNEELVNRIVNADRVKSSRANSTSERKFISLTENLRNVSTISRLTKQKQIQDENNKFFNRLINTSATISRMSWMRDIKSNNSYKSNLHRTKYCNPDYSYEVTRMKKNRKATYKHLKMSRCEKQLPNICNQSKIIKN